MRCKIVNSKTDTIQISKNGTGIENIKKRLGLLYPDKFELKMNSEEDFFAVSLLIELMNNKLAATSSSLVYMPVNENISV